MIKEVQSMATFVYGALGPGWTENIYQEAMELELRLRHIRFEAKRIVPIQYKGHMIGSCIPDLIVWQEDCSSALVVDLKATEYMKMGDDTQVRRYVGELSREMPDVQLTGLLVNFCQAGAKRKLQDVLEEDGLQLYYTGVETILH